MCNKADNSCRQEKQGCQGCFYNIFTDKENKIVEMLKREYKQGKEQDNILFPLYMSEARQVLDLINRLQSVILYLKHLDLSNSKLIRTFSERHLKDRDKIRKLEEITNNYDVICKNDADYILIANKSYFENGIFKDNLISKNKIIKQIKQLEEQCKICNIKNLLDCTSQCTIGCTIKSLKELLED